MDSDTDPHQSGKHEPDPYQSEKQDPDPDPHQSEKLEAREGSFWSIGGSNAGKKRAVGTGSASK